MKKKRKTIARAICRKRQNKMGFTKLDEGILMSSIMRESPEVFKVWIALLAACREDGIARVSTVGVASHCFLSLKSVKEAIEKLSYPDDESRSINDEGRRIRRVDGGFEIINYLKYRELSTQEADARRKWTKRHENKECPDKSGQVRTSPDSSASASASASVSSSSPRRRKHQEPIHPGECDHKSCRTCTIDRSVCKVPRS